MKLIKMVEVIWHEKIIPANTVENSEIDRNNAECQTSWKQKMFGAKQKIIRGELSINWIVWQYKWCQWRKLQLILKILSDIEQFNKFLTMKSWNIKMNIKSMLP